MFLKSLGRIQDTKVPLVFVLKSGLVNLQDLLGNKLFPGRFAFLPSQSHSTQTSKKSFERRLDDIRPQAIKHYWSGSSKFMLSLHPKSVA